MPSPTVTSIHNELSVYFKVFGGNNDCAFSPLQADSITTGDDVGGFRKNWPDRGVLPAGTSSTRRVSCWASQYQYLAFKELYGYSPVRSSAFYYAAVRRCRKGTSALRA